MHVCDLLDFSNKNNNTMNNKILIMLVCVVLGISSVRSQAPEGKYLLKNVSINDIDVSFGTGYNGVDKVIFSKKNKNEKTLSLHEGKLDSIGDIYDVFPIRELSTKFNEGGVVVTNDLETIYFTTNNYKKRKATADSKGLSQLQLHRATKQLDGKWGSVEKLKFNNLEYSIGHPALSPDNKKLYFVSDIPGGYGGSDIYVVDIYSDGSYGELKNLGEKVNTSGKELFPFIDANNVLYYSSDGQEGGLGGLDIYAVRLQGDSVSSDPVTHLEEPINSNKDDFSYILDPTGTKGFISSNRSGGRGGDDIYSFKLVDWLQIVEGVVMDQDLGDVLPGSEISVFDLLGKELKTVTADQDAKYFLELESDKKYIIKGLRKGYEPYTDTIVTTRESVGRKDISLKKEAIVVEVGVDIAIPLGINDVNFDLNKSNIRPDAAVRLNKLIAFLEKHPTVKIFIKSHTDSRGSDNYNRNLSDKRAKSTLEYLVNTGGIDRNRLQAKGYGEDMLLNYCSNGIKCSNEEHEMNRRSEFIISEK